MSMQHGYLKSFPIFIASIVILPNLLFSPINASAQVDQERPPMELEWKLKDAPENVYWPPRDGDKILVVGKINAGYDSTFEIGDPQVPVTITVYDPARDKTSLGQVEPICVYDQCYFEWVFVPGGATWQLTGQYEIQACYHGYNNVHVQCIATDFAYVRGPQQTTDDEQDSAEQIHLPQESDIIIELYDENEALKQEIVNLKSQINQLQTQIDNLNAIVQEQIKVIYAWVITR